jgi:hypothetical protein
MKKMVKFMFYLKTSKNYVAHTFSTIAVMMMFLINNQAVNGERKKHTESWK